VKYLAYGMTHDAGLSLPMSVFNSFAGKGDLCLLRMSSTDFVHILNLSCGNATKTFLVSTIQPSITFLSDGFA
jgi:hypothetical protein